MGRSLRRPCELKRGMQGPSDLGGAKRFTFHLSLFTSRPLSLLTYVPAGMTGWLSSSAGGHLGFETTNGAWSLPPTTTNKGEVLSRDSIEVIQVPSMRLFGAMAIAGRMRRISRRISLFI